MDDPFYTYNTSIDSDIEKYIECLNPTVEIQPIVVKYVRNLLTVVEHKIGCSKDTTLEQLVDKYTSVFEGSLRDEVVSTAEELMAGRPDIPNMARIVNNKVMLTLITLLFEDVEKHPRRGIITCREIDACIHSGQGYEFLPLVSHFIGPRSLVEGKKMSDRQRNLYNNSGTAIVECDFRRRLEYWASARNFTFDSGALLTLASGIEHITYLMTQSSRPEFKEWLESIPSDTLAVGTDLIDYCHQKLFFLVMGEVSRIIGSDTIITYNMVVYGFVNNSVFDLGPICRITSDRLYAKSL